MKPVRISPGISYMTAAGLAIAGAAVTLQADPRAKPPRTVEEVLAEMQEERERDEPTFGPRNRAERRAQRFGR